MGRNSTELTLQTAREVKKAWELFITGDEEHLEKVRPEIRESWLRSRRAGVNPALQQLPTVLDPEELDCRCQQNTYLLEAGREIIPLLCQVFTAEVLITGITDGEGNLLYTYVPPQKPDKRKDTNGFPGAGLQENLVGTTSLGIALRLNKPFQEVCWYENYVEFMHGWTACSAPIHNSWGDTVGALSVSEYREVLHPCALDLVAFAAGYIEEKIRHFEERAHFKALEEFNRYLLKFPESPLLALDPHGHILALSPAMAKLVTLQPPDRLIGRSLRDIRDFRFKEFFPPTAGNSSEPYESSIVLPQQGKACSSTVIPVPSREEERAGMVVIASGLSQLVHKRVTKPLWQATHTFHDLVGRSPAFCHALKLAEKAADHDWPVLLVGESGTGKEIFAHAIHRASRRAQGPFVAVNLSTIPKELAASELFGYEEGAFSGALRGGKRGKIELAHQGTLFLDEVGDMPAEIQGGFLRFLEEGKVVPLGSEHPRPVDVRVIAATNIDPSAAVAQGKLRLDLYHRLNVLLIFLPPLRERLEDLPLLVRHLLDREGFSETGVSPEVLEVFRHYPWPGNIRELRNVLVRAAMLSANRIITREDLPPELLTPKPLPSPQPASPHRLDQEQIRQALKECGGHISRAAQRLGIHRVTLHRKLRAYGLTRESLAKEDFPG